ncbi:MAG: hypothetical protein WKF84_25070 [Pyrinomonadaceae bacterium]
MLRDANRGWENINSDPARFQSVTADDVRRVANTYFTPENRTVVIYYTKKGAAEGEKENPLLTDLDDEEKAQVKQMQAMLGQMKPDQVKMMLTQIEQKASVGSG